MLQGDYEYCVFNGLRVEVGDSIFEISLGKKASIQDTPLVSIIVGGSGFTFRESYRVSKSCSRVRASMVIKVNFKK